MEDIKDLKELKHLFPGMEDYVPEPGETKENPEEPGHSLTDHEKAQMKLYVSRDKKQRAGKQVTLLEGYAVAPAGQEALLKKLKSICSAGGSLKEGVILIQGDHVKKILEYLRQQGFRQVKQKGS